MTISALTRHCYRHEAYLQISITQGGEEQLVIEKPIKLVVYDGTVLLTQRYECSTCHPHVILKLSLVDVFCILATHG